MEDWGYLGFEEEMECLCFEEEMRYLCWHLKQLAQSRVREEVRNLLNCQLIFAGDSLKNRSFDLEFLLVD